MELIKKTTLGLVMALMICQTVSAQSSNWIGQSFEEEATDAHSIYRQALKAQDWGIAFENWQKAYKLAPAADGKRDYHYIDGVKLYIHKFQKETDAAKKALYVDMINKLYDEAVQAYETRLIKPSTCGDDDECYQQKIGYIYNRKGFDMFYSLNSNYSENLAVYDMAIEKAGNEIEYTVFEPVTSIVVYQYQKGKLTKEQTVAYHEKLDKIAAYNLENNEELGAYYDQAWRAAQAKFGPIETEIFDCDYFKPAYKKMYDENPDDMDQLKNLVGLLKKRGCPENDELLMDLEGKWIEYADQVNAERLEEWEANNPSILAKKCYDEGDYKCAIEKYDEAIEVETDTEKKASFLFSKASIQFRKLNQYSNARATAYAAAKMKPNWGRPYMLIGDMYASSARQCGDDWNQRLAIIAAIDKYNYAGSIDSQVAGDAGRRAAKYRSSLPDQTEAHMRSVKAGEKADVGCWIGETVTLRFQ